MVTAKDIAAGFAASSANKDDIAAAFAASSADKTDLPVIALGRANEQEIQKLPFGILAGIAHYSRDRLLHFALAGSSDLPKTLPEDQLARGLAVTAIAYATHYRSAIEALADASDEYLARAIVHPSSLESLDVRLGQVDWPHIDVDRFSDMQAIIAAISRALLGAWTLIAAIRRADRYPDTSISYELRASAVEASHSILSIPFLVGDTSPVLSDLVYSVGLPTAAGVVSALRDGRHRPSFADLSYKALRPEDIILLARRDPELRDLYGVPIERAFERQLALLFMSFGFAVVESVPGERQIDLLCVASESEPQTVLVEAKSTSKLEYPFRAADQRALVEHVHETQRTLGGLPAPKLVLVVAPSFSHGAASRLADAGSRLGLPCHGCPARILSDLRRKHVGHIPPNVFVDQIIRGPQIVTEEVANNMLRIAQASHESWKQFVDVLRQAHSHSR
jgi:hypothetical protein